MKMHLYVVAAGALLAQATAALAQQPKSSTASVVQASLTAPGSPPFHLKATITERDDPTSKTLIEIHWMTNNKWRRTIRSEDFSQTLIVNGDKVFEEDSDNYFPLGLETLVTAMVDPRPVLDALRPGDRVATKANGASQESGLICSPDHHLCGAGEYGLAEFVGTAGHSVYFTDYRAFQGKRVARRLSYGVGGESLTAQVTKLDELKNPDERLFAIASPTAEERRIHRIVLPEAELRSLVLANHDIVWPQVLDGAITGSASFYVSVDPSGKVREVLPVRTANERANESASRQIMNWKFKPVMRNGVPAQAESLLTFTLNTRAWGPPSPLSDSEARKLASNIVEPVIPPGTVPAGTTFTLRTAIDSEGRLIEVIAGDGPSKLFGPCYDAIRKWQFKPFVQNGEPLPYRAEVTFRVR